MSSPYLMTVDLNVLDHLGINLYSNVAAVLTEAVANAWDADASKVNIRVDPDSLWIEIEDDGIGMTVTDINERYLRVGYKRRDHGGEYGKVTAKGRSVMGRKGLGKLSLFSIADSIKVVSAKEGEKHGFLMTAEGIKASVESKEMSYSPKPLLSHSFQIEKGTRIRLSGIKQHRLGRGVAALRKRLARRFSILGQVHGFEITINEVPISPDERGDMAVSQFVWHFGSENTNLSAARELKEYEALPERDPEWPVEWKLKGWLGTARLPKQLDNDDAGNLNSIVIFARGRLFQENVLDKLNDGRLYTKYLTGQVEADFLDDDAKADIATSDRQRVQEDDPRYIKLISFLREQLNRIEGRWNEWRRKHEVAKAKEENAALAEWLTGLPEGYQKSAETMVAKISSLPMDDMNDRRTMYKHAVLAFERMKVRGSAHEFAEGVADVEAVIKLLSDRDSVEASLYRDIVKSRLEAIKAFQGIVDADDKEKVLQQYLFDHLWLLDASWERATGSEIMETRLAQEGFIVDDLTEKERLGRVDIKYRTSAGKHIVVELKKACRKMRLIDLQEQGQTYVDKLKKILRAQNESNPNIEVVFVIGTPIDEEGTNPDRIKNSMAAISPGSRIVHFDTLIKGAQENYAEYLRATCEVDRLQAIVDRL
jgi:hypothetical protein